jgi:hypothetical protein
MNASRRMIAANAMTRTANGSGTSSLNDAAIDPRSAPMLKVFAATTRTTASHSTGLGNRSLMSAMRPRPLG